MNYDTPRLRAKAAGLKRYEGLPCVNCGGTTRLVNCQSCLVCKRQRKYNARKKVQKYPSRGRPVTSKKEYTPEELEAKLVKRRAYQREYWAKPENHGKKRAKKAKRRCAELQRTPAWLTPDDKFLINEIYNLAVERTKQHGFVWEVDHIIPLRGKLVSGLHVPANLQVITQKDNRTKRADYPV